MEPEVSALGYGCIGLSSFYGKPRLGEERLKFLDNIYAAGEIHWDSADMYGDSEDLLGKYENLQ
jgi:aryl-alcohol dehydrogenase-like predicted oxidoreductase